MCKCKYESRQPRPRGGGGVRSPLRRAKRVGGSGNIAMSVRQRTDAVWQQITFVVQRSQTELVELARRDLVSHRLECAKAALRATPVLENVQILMVSDVVLDVALRYPFGFGVGVLGVVGRRCPETVHFTSESAEFGRTMRASFRFEVAQFALVCRRMQRMVGGEIGRVEPVHHASHVGVQIWRFDMQYKTVRVGK